MENTEILNPIQYPWSWLFIAGSFVVLALGYYIVTNLFLRKKKVTKEIEPLPEDLNPYERLSAVKNKYAQLTSAIAHQYDAKEISTRKAFQSLSLLLREFSHEYSRTNAHAMTLADLQNNNSPVVLQERVRAIYPVAFQKAEVDADVHLAVGDMLEVIKRWH